MKSSNLTHLLAAALLMVQTGPAISSSTDAWEEFQQSVAKACRQAMELDQFARIDVEPFGSERFGFAIGYSSAGPMVCVYEKSTGETEVGRSFIRLQSN